MNGGFLINLDSVAQRETLESDSESAFDDLTGVLRVGCLLTGTLLLTDAQVLDGALMLRIGPRGVFSRIGTSFEIYARADSLENSLYQFFDNGGEYLRHIELSSLTNMNTEERINLGYRISQVSSKHFKELSTRLGVVNAVNEVLRSCGVEQTQADELADCWRSWIDADNNGDLVTHERPYGKLDMSLQAQRKPLKNLIPEKSKLPQVELVLNMVEGSSTRSEIRALIQSLELSDDEKTTIREWLDSIYVCSIAKTYDSIAVELPRSSVKRLAQRRTAEESKLLLSTESVDRLSNVRISTFEIIYDKTRDDAKKWREDKKERHIKHLASTVNRDTNSDSAIRRERTRSAFRLAFVAVVLQASSVFDLSDGLKIGLAIIAVITTEFLPVLYRNIFPKGRLTAIIDPIKD